MTINLASIAIWVLRIIPAIILLQTLFFKFSAAGESVYIFTSLGIEPWGRIATGLLELVASLLLLYPRTTYIGAALSLCLMAGAIFSHLTILGISIQGDGGLLFAYALIVFACCAVLLFICRDQLLDLLKIASGKNG